MLTKKCEICKVEFKIHLCRIKKGGGKFCTRKCYGISIKGYTPWNKGKPGLKEENNPMWKGNKVGYTALHDWLRLKYGKANKCENLKCSGKFQKFDWALLKGKEYERKRRNFWMLCRSCHMKYDMTDEWRKNMSKRQLGKRISETAKEKISQASKKYWANKRTLNI